MLTIKLFNINSYQVIDMLRENLPQALNLDIHFYDCFLETKVEINNDEKALKEGIISEFTLMFRDYIYALEDVSIYEMCSRYLDVRHKTISIVELGSCGKIISKLSRFYDAHKYIDEGYSLLSSNSISKYFDIDMKNLKDNNRVSLKNTLDICSYMREHTMSDLVIVNMAVLEYYKNFSQSDVLQNKGTCFIAVGDREGIMTKKFNFGENINEIIEGVAKMSCFLLINKLK